MLDQENTKRTERKNKIVDDFIKERHYCWQVEFVTLQWMSSRTRLLKWPIYLLIKKINDLFAQKFLMPIIAYAYLPL